MFDKVCVHICSTIQSIRTWEFGNIQYRTLPNNDSHIVIQIATKDAILMRRRLLPWLTGSLLLTMAIMVFPEEQDTNYPEVIVSPAQTLQIIPRNTLRAIFGMRLRNWPDLTANRVFVLKDEHPVHIGFAKKVLNIYPHQLRLAWDRLVYSGTGQSPV
jgi:hypothetical protein